MVSRRHIESRLAAQAGTAAQRVRTAEGARLRGDHDFDATLIEADMGNRRARRPDIRSTPALPFWPTMLPPVIPSA